MFRPLSSLSSLSLSRTSSLSTSTSTSASASASLSPSLSSSTAAAAAPVGRRFASTFDLSFGLTEEQQQIQSMALAFAGDSLAPKAAEWDEKGMFSADVLREAASLGFASIYAQEEHGGTGMGRIEAALIFEALSTGCVATTAYLSIHNMVVGLVDHFGSDELRAKFLPKLCSMDNIASYCLTEPSSGSDAASLRTKAVKDGDHYVLTGEKAFISGGGFSDVYLVMARTGEPGPKGITAFLVEKGTPGLSFGANEKKMGWKGQPTSAVIMDNVRVPASHIVGAEGQGFTIAMKGLDGGRINIGACSLGGAYSALKAAKEYTGVRKQFGKTLDSNQNVQFTLAEMAMNLHASRMMIRSAANLLDASDPGATIAAAMGKKFATDNCYTIVNKALQLHGGYGYLADYQVERTLRDLRVHQILEGTNEVMSMIISRGVIGHEFA